MKNLFTVILVTNDKSTDMIKEELTFSFELPLDLRDHILENI